MPTMTTPSASPTPPRCRRWLRRSAIALASLLALLAATTGWLLGTASGLRFALARAQAITHGALHVQQAHGRLIGPLDLSGVRYDDGKGTLVRVATLHLDLRFWPLLRQRVHVLALDVDGADVALPKPSPDDTSGSSTFSLKPPVELVLDRVHVGSVKVTQGGEPLFASNRLDLAGSWTNHGIELRQLALQAPDGHAELDGRMAVGPGHQLHLLHEFNRCRLAGVGGLDRRAERALDKV